MLKVVCFKWTTGSKKPYTGAHVNRLYESLRYYTSGDFSLTCITDDRSGISNEIDMIEMPESCRKVVEFRGRQYPKLYLFSEEFSAYIKDKFVYLDLDVVLTGDISFLARSNARLSIMSGVGKKALYGRLQYLVKRRKIPRTDAPVNSSVMAVEPFSHTHIWDSFDPRRSPNQIAQSRLVGTDQAWIYLTAHESLRIIGASDGLYRAHTFIGQSSVSPDCRIVVFTGHWYKKPWEAGAKEKHPWLELYPT